MEILNPLKLDFFDRKIKIIFRVTLTELRHKELTLIIKGSPNGSPRPDGPSDNSWFKIKSYVVPFKLKSYQFRFRSRNVLKYLNVLMFSQRRGSSWKHKNERRRYWLPGLFNSKINSKKEFSKHFLNIQSAATIFIKSKL